MIKIFLTVDDRKMIRQKAIESRIPEIYITGMVEIFNEVINREPKVINMNCFEPITAEDYD